MNNLNRESSFHQAESMGKFSNVPITPQEKEKYVFMREGDAVLCDQCILANIIAEFDPPSLLSFWKAYPNIFSTELSKVQ